MCARDKECVYGIAQVHPAAGTVLLEVVLALTLLVLACGVVLGALGQCARRLAQVRREATATNLAVTAMSEIQMGVLTAEKDTPVPYDAPFEGWSRQVVEESLTNSEEAPGLRRVEVIIRYAEDPRDRPYVYRLVEWLPDQQSPSDTEDGGTTDGP